ncbi:hypothetical protein ACKKBF_B39900 [Auxenochlorella protothecoides x Auxenochlorella symbiontica]
MRLDRKRPGHAQVLDSFQESAQGLQPSSRL